jgi:hypothetical protein
MYACLSGGPPQAADQRLENDNVILASQRWIGQYSPQLLETIDWCMELNHLKRPQSVFALQKALATWDRDQVDAAVAAGGIEENWLGRVRARLSALVGK